VGEKLVLPDDMVREYSDKEVVLQNPCNAVPKKGIICIENIHASENIRPKKLRKIAATHCNTPQNTHVFNLYINV